LAFSSIWTSVAAILATLEIAKSDETVLPEDGRYFSPGTIVQCVSQTFLFFCLTDAKGNIDIRSLSNAASSLVHKLAST
jgi:hypothetical protein